MYVCAHTSSCPNKSCHIGVAMGGRKALSMGFLGAGQMATALAVGFLRSGKNIAS